MSDEIKSERITPNAGRVKGFETTRDLNKQNMASDSKVIVPSALVALEAH